MSYSNGKGKGPIKGYDFKAWYAHYDSIEWSKKWCAWCGKWGTHTSGSCSDLKKHLKNKKYE